MKTHWFQAVLRLRGSVSARILPLLLEAPQTGPRRHDVAVDKAVIAGWTGRDAAAVEKHILELAALGVKRPASTPIFYRVAATRLTCAESIEVLGGASSGEVEFVLLQFQGRLWVGTGSDHTDREVEAYGVSVSKQMCEKPIAPQFWAYDDVAPHWDRLLLRSYATIGGTRSLYQEGPVTEMLYPEDLISRYAKEGRWSDGTLMFCGTLPVHGGVRTAERFEFALEDPVRERKIRHAYTIVNLPNPG